MSITTHFPRLQPYQPGDLPGSLRVAFCSNDGEGLDGHFGSCLRFLIYQVARQEARLIELREAPVPAGPLRGEENIMQRVNLISDCHLLYVLSIGGPAAARVVHRGVHPLKRAQAGPIRQELDALREVLASGPPPWLARIIAAPVTGEFEATD
jgi:nitrogen fixation protein NifX